VIGDTDNNDDDHQYKHLIRLVGNYQSRSFHAVEIDSNTFIIASSGETLNVWNKAKCERLCYFIARGAISCLIRSKDKSLIVCGMYDGAVEMRRTDDLGIVLSSFKVHSKEVRCISELEDCSFVSGS